MGGDFLKKSQKGSMEQDKHGEQYSARNKTSLTSLAQILGHASPDDEILAKREETSVSFGSLQADLLNPITKKLKLEGGLEQYYKLAKIFVARIENINVPPVKQEEAGPDVNVKLEEGHSQISGQGHSKKPESKQSDTQEETYQPEDSKMGKSIKDGSYLPVKSKLLCHK
jgi:hypothetical protein